MPTLDLVKNSHYVAKSQAKKRAQVGDEEYRRIEAERKRIYRGKKEIHHSHISDCISVVCFL